MAGGLSCIASRRDWLPEPDAPQNGKGLLFEFPFDLLTATKGEKRLLSRESVLEAARTRINRPETWSLKDRLRLARECAKNLRACPALTRKALAGQLQMTTARLNQILSLLRLAPEIQREIRDLTPTADKRLTERKLLSLLELNSSKTQVEGFQKLLAGRRSPYRK